MQGPGTDFTAPQLDTTTNTLFRRRTLDRRATSLAVCQQDVRRPHSLHFFSSQTTHFPPAVEPVTGGFDHIFTHVVQGYSLVGPSSSEPSSVLDFDHHRFHSICTTAPADSTDPDASAEHSETQKYCQPRPGCHRVTFVSSQAQATPGGTGVTATPTTSRASTDSIRHNPPEEGQGSRDHVESRVRRTQPAVISNVG